MEKDVDEILKKYSRKIEEEMHGFESTNKGIINGSGNVNDGIEGSKEYLQFKQDMMPELSKYSGGVFSSMITCSAPSVRPSQSS